MNVSKATAHLRRTHRSEFEKNKQNLKILLKRLPIDLFEKHDPD